jgi:CRP/FNR family transcriptional regulator, cyclic AMP receptor protein
MHPVHPCRGEYVNRSQIVESLQAVPLFAGLSKKELGVIATVVKEVKAASGDVLAKEGGPGVGFFLILDGSTRVMVNGRTRRRLGPGDTFGEIALLDHGPRTADVIAEGDVQLLGITVWEFNPLLADYPSITLKLLREVAARLRTCSGSDVA